MPLDDVSLSLEERGEKTLSNLKKEFARVRTGRANPAILDGVRVDYYNVPTPLNQLASINVADARMLVVAPFDKGAINIIEKAITAADLGLNPSNDGHFIRIPIPALTEERRKDLVKQVKKMAEEARVAVRNSRRNANDEIKKMLKDKEITEDDQRKGLDDTQKKTDDLIKNIDELAAEKEKDIMDV